MRVGLLGMGVAVVVSMAACGSGQAQQPSQSATSAQQSGGITASRAPSVDAAFDLVRAEVAVDGSDLVFRATVAGAAGSSTPAALGSLDGAKVYAYVWPTTLDSSAVGFGSGAGILALTVTAHPDFDDTPALDENRDGKADNDGAGWHAHWVVLTKDAATCPAGLAVKDIPQGASPGMPSTWPKLPIFITSPAYQPTISGDTVQLRVPRQDLGGLADFRYDGVTSGLRVGTGTAPMLCVTDVFDIASGNLSLPGQVER